MTVQELENTLLTLGCTDFEEEEFTYAVNAALRKLFNDCEIIKKGVIFAHGITPSSVREVVYHAAGEKNSYPLVGKAYSVKLCGGAPKIVVGSGTGSTTHLLSDGVTVLKGFLSNNAGIISFCGNYDYTAYDICCYSELISSERNQIPDGSDYTIYDATEYIDDFRSFESTPVDAFGNPIEDMVVMNSEITVKTGYKGEIHFKYRAGPSQNLYFNSDAEIYVPQEYEMLLVPLFMSIYLVNIDADRAKECKELYLSLLDGVPRYKDFSNAQGANNSTTAEYLIKDGWA
jgi:hypothetical protein